MKTCKKCGQVAELAAGHAVCRACRTRQVRERKRAQRSEGIRCAICGAGLFVAIGQHVRQSHGMAPGDYWRLYPDAERMPEAYRRAWGLETLERGFRPGSRRRTHCKRGHPLRGWNAKPDGRGGRKCRECSNAAARRPRLEVARCADCGQEFGQPARGGRSTRCEACRDAYWRGYRREWKLARR